MWTLLMAIGWAGAAQTQQHWWTPWAAATGAVVAVLFTAWLGQESQRQLTEERE